jgi:hypothetical protein
VASYLSIDEFKVRSAMPAEDIDLVVAGVGGEDFVNATLEDWSGEINDRLRKRYATPFAAPPPRIVLRWLRTLATPDIFRRRGCNPSDPTLLLYEKDKDAALAELREAADAKDGLFELPLRDDAQGTPGVTAGGPLGYSETSPYRWTDQQAEDGHNEDSQ